MIFDGGVEEQLVALQMQGGGGGSEKALEIIEKMPTLCSVEKNGITLEFKLGTLKSIGLSNDKMYTGGSKGERHMSVTYNNYGAYILVRDEQSTLYALDYTDITQTETDYMYDETLNYIVNHYGFTASNGGIDDGIWSVILRWKYIINYNDGTQSDEQESGRQMRFDICNGYVPNRPTYTNMIGDGLFGAIVSVCNALEY